MSTSSEWLVMAPTAFELEQLELRERDRYPVELCGFGLVAAAAMTSRLIHIHRPEQVLLCGIAGALTTDVEVGAAYQFERVSMFGIGVGHGAQHVSAEQLGWKQFELGTATISEEIELDIDCTLPPNHTRKQLASCCAASADGEDAKLIRKFLPLASAEEMEGFAVAAACRIAAVPCHVVRGISNVAGNREHANWQVGEAMRSVSVLVNQILGATQ